ncbi:MAG TPA: helix-turn-helix transcriptional regulator [Solirubrobacterales bacterium]|nr:helix-turn-helix transcriptional regulator [Solirubrobacterales bacterium]
MSPAGLIADVLNRSGLTQAELARRAGLPRSVLNAYLKGTREPGADALLRIAAAGGVELEIAERRPPVDPERASKILNQVLGLAEALPYRPRAEMAYPPLKDRLTKAASA